jgi:hypothetical protein
LELKERLSSVLVGTPSKGSLNHFGEILHFELPNFPVRVNYSTKYFEYKPGYKGGSIYPDIPVITTYDDYVKGIDKEIEAVRLF